MEYIDWKVDESKIVNYVITQFYAKEFYPTTNMNILL